MATGFDADYVGQFQKVNGRYIKSSFLDLLYFTGSFL